MAVRTAMDRSKSEGKFQTPTNEITDDQRATIRALFINEARDSQLCELLRLPPDDPERVGMLDYLNELSDEERSRFRDKYGLNRDYLLDEGMKLPLVLEPVTPSKLNDADLAAHVIGLIDQLLEGRPVAKSIVKAAWDEVAPPEATSTAPGTIPLNQGNITSDQMDGWRAVNAVKSRAKRANLTPEQTAQQTKQAAKRVAAYRERMTPEQRAVRNAKAAEHMRKKRALAKAPQP